MWLVKSFSFYFLGLLALLLTGCATPTSSFEKAQKNYESGDYSRAFENLWPAAQGRDPRAEYAMGYMYYYGIGTDKDQDIARSLISKSARQNYTPAIVAIKMINQRRHDQYVPFEKYNRANRHQGTITIKQQGKTS